MWKVIYHWLIFKHRTFHWQTSPYPICSLFADESPKKRDIEHSPADAPSEKLRSPYYIRPWTAPNIIIFLYNTKVFQEVSWKKSCQLVRIKEAVPLVSISNQNEKNSFWAISRPWPRHCFVWICSMTSFPEVRWRSITPTKSCRYSCCVPCSRYQGMPLTSMFVHPENRRWFSSWSGISRSTIYWL